MEDLKGKLTWALETLHPISKSSDEEKLKAINDLKEIFSIIYE